MPCRKSARTAFCTRSIIPTKIWVRPPNGSTMLPLANLTASKSAGATRRSYSVSNHQGLDMSVESAGQGPDTTRPTGPRHDHRQKCLSHKKDHLLRAVRRKNEKPQVSKSRNPALQDGHLAVRIDSIP